MKVGEALFKKSEHKGRMQAFEIATKGIRPMEKIASFTIDHTRLLPGIYVSRKDADPATSGVVTTFDLRMTAPNREPVINNAPLHAIEHLGATYLRNQDDWKDRVLYFGPMGCRTGFYLLMFGDLQPADVADLVRGMFEFVAGFKGDIPGASPAECGNWHDSDLVGAKWWAARYLENTLTKLGEENTIYPEL